MLAVRLVSRNHPYCAVVLASASAAWAASASSLAFSLLICSMMPFALREIRSISGAAGTCSSSGRKSIERRVKCLRFEIGRPWMIVTWSPTRPSVKCQLLSSVPGL